VNIGGRSDGLALVGRSEEEVDFHLVQEGFVYDGNKVGGMDGNEIVGGVGGFLKRRREAVVATLIHKRWRDKYRVIVRERVRIGVVLEVNEGRKVEIWNICGGEGKHRGFEWVEEDGNKVVMGDINEHHERWGGDKDVENVEGRRISNWMDEERWILGSPRGVAMRRLLGKVERERVLDLGLWTEV